ncbi:helix-turn-helix transcriptional regulator [Arsenicicoccus bolidensis]|uniref:helix-turn-helix transcriptional regulator n=1 Tax=Arsenicicoccus bolidensis TaxID=229480 RepID=UPI00040F8973|nr:LuxR family transcriptional regulator [Arsenicicoccus bolidensis]
MSDGATASRWVDPDQAASLRDALGELVARPGGLVVVIGPLGSGHDALTDAVVEQVSRRSGLQPRVLRARPGDRSWAVGAGETVVQTVSAGETAGVDRHEARQGDADAADPSFVVVHDAHLADPDLLAPLVDRAGAPGPDRPTVVLVHDGTLGLPLVPDHRCVVRPLDLPRVQERIDARGLGHRLAAMRVVEHTAGLADLVEDLLTHLATDLTASALDVRLGSTPSARSDAHAVVSRLDGPARDVVELVSVLGTLDLDDLAALTGEADPTASVDDAVRSAPVRLVDDGYRVRVAPVAPMLAAAVVEAMPLARRQAAHRRAAAVAQDDLERARHVLRGSPLVDEAAVEEVVRLGRGAAQHGDWRRASAALTLAVRTTREADRRQALLPEALDAAAGAGQLVTADQLVPAVSAGPPSVLRDAALGYHAIMVGRPDRAEVCLDQAWRQCNPRTRPAQAVQVAGRRALHALCSWDGAELEQWGARAALLGGDDHASRLEAECTGAIGTAILGDAGRARTRLAEILHDHPIGPHRQRVALAAGWVELATGDADTAAHRLEDACGRPGDEGSVRIAMWAQGWLARARFDAGQWAAAIRLVERGSSLGDSTQLRLGEPLLHWTGAQVNALMGRWAAADRHAQRAACPVDAYPVMRIPAALARAQVCEARADYDGVVRHLAPVAAMPRRRDIDEPGFWQWHQPYANALVVLGRLDDADAFLTPLEARAEDRHRAGPVAALATARARWHGGRGDVDAATSTFALAVEAATAAHQPFQVARIHYSQGLVLRRAGRRREADESLRTAQQDFRDLGADAYAERCERELKATGVAQARRPGRATELTAQEEAVARLVAAGHPNRDVARELSLSVKTVQYHLTNVYGKLQVRGRTELAAAWVAEDHSPAPSP